MTRNNENVALTVQRRNHKSTMKSLEGKPREIDYAPVDSGNRIIHFDSLRELIKSNVVCEFCGCEMRLAGDKVGIATQIVLSCKNKDCYLCKTNIVRKTNYRKYEVQKNSFESFALIC